MKPECDPFTLEVIREGLQSGCDEMFVSMRRAAMSAVIYEVLDFGVGITDAQGRLVAQGNGITVFVGVLESCVQATMRKFGGALNPGDVFISNDPYSGGATHLNDVSLVMPVIVDGTVLAFTAVKAHWTDVGGAARGSVSEASSDVFQEGIIIPDVRVIDGGTPVQSVLEFLSSNTRLPKQMLGDLWAGIAAVRVGAARVEALVKRYGREALHLAIQHSLKCSADVALLAMQQLPAGRFTAEAVMDDVSTDGSPVRVRVSVAVSASEFVVDLRGNPPQIKNAYNCTYPATVAAIRSIFVALTAPHGVINHGSFAPLRVLADEGSVFAACHPAAIGLYGEPLIFASDLVWKALAPHMPDRLGAGHFLAVAALIFAGPHADTGEFCVAVGPNVGGWGADSEADGATALFQNLHGATQNTPVEIFEAKYGIDVRRYSLSSEPGGEGLYCGGKGIYIEYQVRAEEMALTTLFSRHRTPAWGMNGGRDGSVSTVRVDSVEGSSMTCPRTTGLTIRRGDIVRVWTGHGGGFGDPRYREASRVRDDLRNEYITTAQAAAIFDYHE